MDTLVSSKISRSVTDLGFSATSLDLVLATERMTVEMRQAWTGKTPLDDREIRFGFQPVSGNIPPWEAFLLTASVGDAGHGPRCIPGTVGEEILSTSVSSDGVHAVFVLTRISPQNLLEHAGGRMELEILRARLAEALRRVDQAVGLASRNGAAS